MASRSAADEISAGALVVLPILLVAAAIYWVLTTVLSLVLNLVERSLAIPGTSPNLGQ
jgi:ABC-type amino acid transport system permease subunit